MNLDFGLGLRAGEIVTSHDQTTYHDQTTCSARNALLGAGHVLRAGLGQISDETKNLSKLDS